MSQMNNPYASLQRDDMLVEKKVSVTAIIALVVAVLGLIVCVAPGLAGLGALLGVAALVVISQNAGRIGGRGLAIAAIVIGLLMTILQVGAIIGIRQVSSQLQTAFVGPVAGMMTAAENKDLATLRGVMTAGGSARLTQPHVDAFRDGYAAELGAFKGVPTGWFNLIKSYQSLGPLMQRFQGANDIVPVPGEFENGVALIALQLDSSGAPGKGLPFPLINVKVIVSSGNSWTLYPGDGTTTTVTPGGPDFPAKPDGGSSPGIETPDSLPQLTEPAPETPAP